MLRCDTKNVLTYRKDILRRIRLPMRGFPHRSGQAERSMPGAGERWSTRKMSFGLQGGWVAVRVLRGIPLPVRRDGSRIKKQVLPEPIRVAKFKK